MKNFNKIKKLVRIYDKIQLLKSCPKSHPLFYLKNRIAAKAESKIVNYQLKKGV